MLFEGMYRGIKDGGPASGLKIIHVLVWQINKLLLPHKKIIRSKDPHSGRGNCTVYYMGLLR